MRIKQLRITKKNNTLSSLFQQMKYIKLNNSSGMTRNLNSYRKILNTPYENLMSFLQIEKDFHSLFYLIYSE